MKEAVKQWMTRAGAIPGLLACGVRFPDQSVVLHTALPDLAPATLEIALRGLADTFQVLSVHRIPATRFRLVYEQGYLYCIRRPDELLLGIFTSRADLDAAALEPFVASFFELQPAPAG